MGAGKYFKYVGEDTLDGAKPTTEYIRANINLKEPAYYDGTAANLINSLKDNAANGYTPTYVKASDGTNDQIYTPAFHWNPSEYNTLHTYNYGDLVFKDDTDQILQMHTTVKGTWGAGQYATGDYVLHDGICISYRCDWCFEYSNALQSRHIAAFDAVNAYSAGEGVLAGNNQITVATKMKGEFNPMPTTQMEMLFIR